MEEEELGATLPDDSRPGKVTSASHPPGRPLPLRTISGAEGGYSPSEERRRRKSTSLNLEQLPSRRDTPDHPKLVTTMTCASDRLNLAQSPGYGTPKDISSVQHLASNPTPPITPMKKDSEAGTLQDEHADILKFDFSEIYYDIVSSHKAITTGRSSIVHFARPRETASQIALPRGSTPPATPHSEPKSSPCNLYAVKEAKDAIARKTFPQEAKMLTKLQQTVNYGRHIVPFYGLDERRLYLVFEAIEGGPGGDPSLAGFVNGLTTMTEEERQPEMRGLFLTAAYDLIDGLKFIHATGIVHADIKPANVLIDVVYSEDASRGSRIRARYIDFSSSFLLNESAAHAGGTDHFMAPEQITSNKDLSKPTFASDIWSLGISLLFILVGGSPYAAARGVMAGNILSWVKDGKPLMVARLDPVVKKRIEACQDLVDCCRMALHKDRDSRPSAASWLERFEKDFLQA